MFRKLVANLPFSPALVGQLGFYAKRLKKEEFTRRLGFVFTALALIVQSFTVFSPPEAANAANPSDMIHGGVRSVRDILDTYDQSARGNGDFKDIMDYAGVTRAELAALKDSSVNSRQFGTKDNAVLSWGRVHRMSSAQGEVKHIIPRSDGSTSTIFTRPIWRYDSTNYTKKYGSTYDAFVGHSKELGWFAIMKDCGNLLTKTTPKKAPKGSFISATCDKITGYAYDGRRTDLKVKVYLYFDGPPGKGERVGPILAKGNNPSSPANGNHGFSFDVPEKFQRADHQVKVFGVLVPLAGWTAPSVQFTNTVQIAQDCYTPTPVATCDSLNITSIERTKFNMEATANVANGAKITGYTWIVKDQQGNTVAEKTTQNKTTSGELRSLELADTGSYSASVAVNTTTGNKTSPDCTKQLTVATPDQCAVNPALAANDPSCNPCPGNETLWAESDNCSPEIIQGKQARNLTQDTADAQATRAQAGDRIEYIIYLENTGFAQANIELEEELGDVLEYASLRNTGGGTFDNNSKTLNWGETTLKPGERQERKFVVDVSSEIPSTPRGVSDPGSYDCRMDNAFGNNTSIEVDCPVTKSVEQTVTELPKTGAGENIAFGATLLAIVAYFYARSRQTAKEIRLIRRDFNAGTI